jgi:hypothetical protein
VGCVASVFQSEDLALTRLSLLVSYASLLDSSMVFFSLAASMP